MPAMMPGDAARIVARIERLPNSPWHLRMRAVVGVTYFFDGFDALTIAFVLPALIPLWHLGPVQIGTLIATGYAGQALGSVFFGWLAERIGRVPCALASCAIFSVFSLACAFSPGLDWLIALRFLQGLGLGGEMPVMQSYLNEFSRTHRRGRFALLTQLPFAFGIAVTSLVAAFVVPAFGWQWMFVIGALPGFITLFMRRVLPESPRWLVSAGRADDAARVMDRIEASITASGIALPPLGAVVREAEPARGGFADLFRGVYKRRTLTIWALWICTYLVSYGLSAWMPSLYRTVYKLPVDVALRYGVYTSVALFLGGCLLTATIDLVGRRVWIGAALLISGLVLVGLYQAPVMQPWNVMMISLVPFFGIGAISLVLGSYTAENYPTSLRALGTGVGNAWLRATSVGGPYLVGWMITTQGLGGVFVMFGAVAALGGAVALLFATETNERLLEEVSPVVG